MAERKFCAGCLRGDENNTGEAWCCDCAELVCKPCSSCHKKLSPPHKIVPVERVSNLSSSLLNLSRNCQFHNDQKLVLFCCQHDHLVCDSCVSESHQNCKPVISIEMAAKVVQKSTAVTELEKRIDNLIRIMENILSIYNTEISDLGEWSVTIYKQISEIRQKINSHLDTVEASFKNELDSKYKECNENLIKNKSDIQRRYDATWRKDMESLKDNASNVHLFHVIKYLDAKTHNEETELRNFKKDGSIPKLTFRPAREISKIYDILSSFGALSLNNSPIPTSPDLDIDQQGQALVRSKLQKEQLSLVTSFTKSKLGYVLQIDRGCFVPDNKLFLCDHVKKRVYLCDHDGSNSKTIKLDFSPCNATLYDRNTALVSAGDGGIQIIDLQTLQPGRLIPHGKNSTGITSLHGKIWVRSDVSTFTMIDIYGKIHKKVLTSFDPYDICLTKDGDIYCTDFNSDDVYIVTSRGEERVVYKSPDLRGAVGITVDDQGNVYIAGNLSHNIHRISSGGQQSNINLTRKSDFKPSGLSFNNPTKELMVVYYNGERCSIYKVS